MTITIARSLGKSQFLTYPSQGKSTYSGPIELGLTRRSITITPAAANTAYTIQSLVEFAGIEHVPGVSGGDPVIIGTRIPVWLLVQAHQMGLSDDQLLYDYPSLRVEDLTNAWGYYARHTDEIDRQIADNENA